MTQLGARKSVGAVVADHLPTPATGRVPRWLRSLLDRPSIGMLVVLILLLAVFSLLRPHAFLGTYNIRNIALAAAVIGVVAVGQTFVLATGGIDLSVGSVLVFSTVVSAKVMTAMGGTDAGWGTTAVGIVVCVAAGAFWGLVSGLIVTYLRVPPLIATLGTLGMALGAAQILTGGLDIHSVPSVMTNQIGYENIVGIPLLVVIAAVVALIAGLVLWQTGFGTHTKAIGSNREGALRAGIAVRRHLVSIYLVSGALAGVGGVMSLAQFSTTTIGGHTGDNLTTIAGAVLGGTSLFGGVATIFGTVVGILVPVTLQSGFVIVNVQPFWQTFAVGAVLVIAVFVDQVRRGGQNRR
ncbi:MAG TPA: ABC transporter permease [Pseudonocardiaceae bacterium]|jgi:ribose transport system permease protein|nr:ABC transporter permease [Pseudonocardiaceae bacterium]